MEYGGFSVSTPATTTVTVGPDTYRLPPGHWGLPTVYRIDQDAYGPGARSLAFGAVFERFLRAVDPAGVTTLLLGSWDGAVPVVRSWMTTLLGLLDLAISFAALRATLLSQAL